jgi:NitT/TauT family transport system ATP-binding protein
MKKVPPMTTSDVAANAATEPHIVLRGVTKHYADLCVLDHLDLEIGSGEILSIVGPSGCGKTTLLRCLNGLVIPDGGEVVVAGEQITGPRDNLAIVFQDFGLFPWKTVLGNVGYGLKVRGRPRKEVDEAARTYIDLVGLSGFENSYPHELSGGMQQRAGLARALAVEPDVLLMDEPFGALDAQTRESLQFELLQIWERNPITMVFVTHAIEEAVLMGDRIVVLGERTTGIREIVDVPLGRPRDEDTLASPAFQQLRQHVRELIRGSSSPQRELSGAPESQ